MGRELFFSDLCQVLLPTENSAMVHRLKTHWFKPKADAEKVKRVAESSKNKAERLFRQKEKKDLT